MEGVLKQGSKKLLFFVLKKLLLLCRSARPISQRIASRLVFKLERPQIKVEARNYFLAHLVEAYSRIITDTHHCLT